MVNLDDISPELVFTPERRRIEYQLAEDNIKAISKLDVPEEEKETVKEMWKSYLINYEHLYKKYRREKAIAIEKSLSLLN
jgi:hypothetical protein